MSAAFLVGRDGSPAWQLARAVGVVVLTAVAAYGVAKWARTAAAAVAWLAGVVGVSVGVGVGVFHLAKSGPIAVTLAGLGCFVSGVFLLSWGSSGSSAPRAVGGAHWSVPWPSQALPSWCCRRRPRST